MTSDIDLLKHIDMELFHTGILFQVCPYDRMPKGGRITAIARYSYTMDVNDVVAASVISQ